ncbi:MAG: DUF3822 family protein [Chitinophagaceae bacterium]
MKQVFHILSDSTINSSEKVLAIRAGEKHFGFAVTSPDAAELYRLAWYTDTRMEEDSLQEIYKNHPELSDSYSRILVGYDHPQSVLVPQVHYHQEEAPQLLKAVYGTLDQDLFMTEYVADWQIQNIYTVPRETTEWISRHFATGDRWHTYTIGLKNTGFIDPEGSLAIDIRPEDFSLLVTKGNKLLLAQTYSYSNPADVLYHLLNTCRQFSFTQESVQVVLSGLITQESALYRELYNYFLHLKFRDSGWLLPEGDQQYPLHFFTSLNDLARCAS